MTEPKNVIQSMIDSLTGDGKDLTEEEQKFMESVRRRWKAESWITDEQEERLIEIYEERV